MQCVHANMQSYERCMTSFGSAIQQESALQVCTR